jgi:hypothetical protein
MPATGQELSNPKRMWNSTLTYSQTLARRAPRNVSTTLIQPGLKFRLGGLRL